METKKLNKGVFGTYSTPYSIRTLLSYAMRIPSIIIWLVSTLCIASKSNPLVTSYTEVVMLPQYFEITKDLRNIVNTT